MTFFLQSFVPHSLVTFVDLLLFSAFMDIPGASRIKTSRRSHIQIMIGKMNLDKNLDKIILTCGNDPINMYVYLSVYQ